MSDTNPQAIEDALDVLLTRLIEHRKAQPPFKGPIKLMTAAEFAAIPTRDDAATNHIIQDPIEGALLLAIRKLGERLFKIGNISLMHQVCERVCGRNDRQYGHRVGILDHRWDGIGSSKDHPGWVC